MEKKRSNRIFFRNVQNIAFVLSLHYIHTANCGRTVLQAIYIDISYSVLFSAYLFQLLVTSQIFNV